LKKYQHVALSVAHVFCTWLLVLKLLTCHAHIPAACGTTPLADGFSRHWDEIEFGPNLDYREHSFLNSTDLPHVIKESAVNVVVCSKGKGYCPEPDAPGTVDVNKIFLQENLLSEQIKM
jgi:hypothetical protein